MQLQEGKYYEARNGAVYGPMNKREPGPYTFAAQNLCWRANGRYDSNTQDDFRDLLHEVEKPKRIEPTYEERQAAWLAEHGLKVGDKVKVVSESFPSDWPTHWLASMTRRIGTIQVIHDWDDYGVQLGDHDGAAYPYTSLEPYKEPQYRPFTFEEAKTELYKKDVVHKESGSFGMAFCLYLGSDSHAQYTTQWWFDNYTFPDGAPCGKLI